MLYEYTLWHLRCVSRNSVGEVLNVADLFN